MILLVLAIVFVVAMTRIKLVVNDPNCKDEVNGVTTNILVLRVIALFNLIGIITLFFV